MSATPGTRRETVWRNVASAGLVVTWSAGFIGTELGTNAGAGPYTLLFWRFLVLTLILAGACLVSGTSLRGGHAWRRQAFLGLFNQVGYLGFMFLGISCGVHGGTAALIAALQPLLVMTVAGRLLGEKRGALAWVGTALGLVGVVVVVSGDIAADEVAAWVYALPTLAMLSLTIGTVLSKRIRPPETLLQTITMQSAVCAVVFTAVAAASDQLVVPSQPGAFVAIAWLVLISSICGYALYVYVTHHGGATVVSTLLYLTPPTTMVWAFLMFGDPITRAGLLGLAISAVGVVMVLRSVRSADGPDRSRTTGQARV